MESSWASKELYRFIMNCPVHLVNYYTVIWSSLKSRDDLCSNKGLVKIYKGFYIHRHYGDRIYEIWTSIKPKVTSFNDLIYIMGTIYNPVDLLFEIDFVEEKGETTNVLYPSSIGTTMP